MHVILLVIGGVCLFPLFALYDGWVVHTIYQWYAVPYLGAPQLYIWQVAGLVLMFRLAAPKPDVFKKGITENSNTQFATGILGPLVVLLVAWVLKAVFA